jgi:hypothetical protein
MYEKYFYSTLRIFCKERLFSATIYSQLARYCKPFLHKVECLLPIFYLFEKGVKVNIETNPNEGGGISSPCVNAGLSMPRI